MNLLTEATHLGAKLQTLEKVTQQLNWSSMSIEMDFKVKITCQYQHWSHHLSQLPFNNFLKNYVPFMWKCILPNFCNLKYKDYFKSFWFINKQKTWRTIFFLIVNFILRVPFESSPTFYLQYQWVWPLWALSAQFLSGNQLVSLDATFWKTDYVFWLIDYNNYTLNLPFLS